MKTLYTLITLLLLAGCKATNTETSISTANKSEPNYELLRAELEEVYDIDQNIRKVDWDTISTPEASIAFSKKMMAVDSLNQLRVLPIVDQYGWLPKSKIGEKAANAIFLVIQHSNTKTIEKYLPQMEELAKQGETSTTDAAKMRDRLLMFQGKKQIYGTQAANWVRSDGSTVMWPVEDVENVNKRRKEAGFTTTIEENAKRLRAEFDPNEELPKKKDN